MAETLLDLDVQARAQVFTFGDTSAGGAADITYEKGTGSASQVTVHNKGSETIDGDVVIGGNLTVTGVVDTVNATNTDVADKTISVNKGGTTALATGSGIKVLGDKVITTDFGTNPTYITLTNHGLSVNQGISFTGVDVPAPLVTGTTYYVQNVVDANNFEVALTQNAVSPITLTDDGTGTSKVVGVTIAQVLYNPSSATNFQVGDGATQVDVVGRTSSQTLTNKTINATDNSITDTSQAAGDLLKNNGTKFVRFAMGTALQQLRVNAGGTDLEYFTPAASAIHRRTSIASGTQNGTNKVFTITNALGVDTDQVFKNGQLLTPGAIDAADYNLSGTTLTFTRAPKAKDVITIMGAY